MKIAFILLAAAVLSLCVWVYILSRRIDSLLARLTIVAQNERDYRKEAQKELSKVHSYATDNAEAIRKLRRRVKEIGEGTKNMEQKTDKEIEELLKRQDDFDKEIEEIKERQKNFDDLADESVRAQIESEKAWAEGVRSIANFGAAIPTLNTKGLENE